MWRYISVKVIPDYTHLRYPPEKEKNAKNINRKRLFSGKRRIWIKTLWWYIFLSWQGDYDSTYEILKDNSVDNINKLIETPGKGYRLELYRAIMKEYSLRERNAKYFGKVMKLNNTKCRTIEPLLFAGTEYSYVKSLFDIVPNRTDKEE